MADLPDIVLWDPSRSVSQGRVPLDNNGCPDGYFAQYVGVGEPGATTIPGKGYAIRCRLMDTTTPETIMAETGITTDEALAVYTEAANDTYKQVKEAVGWGLPWVAILIAAVGAVWFLGGRR